MSPSRRRSSRRLLRARGFTLLEVMVAMIFVALLASGIVLSLTTALRVWRRTTEQNELNQEARAVMSLLTRDLRGAYLGMARDGGFLIGGVPLPKETGVTIAAPQQDSGPFDTVFLTTDSSSAGEASLLPEEVQQNWDQEQEPPVSDMLAVRWEWRDATRGKDGQPAGLYRITSVIPAGDPSSFFSDTSPDEFGQVSAELISETVRGLRFRYFDAEQGQWVDYWDSRDPWDPQRPTQWRRVPESIAIELEVLDPGEAATARATGVSNPSARTHTFRTIVTLAMR